MVYAITNYNLVVVTGGHKDNKNLGSQRHYPIFKDEDQNEYISLNGLVLRKISELNLTNVRRESVERK